MSKWYLNRKHPFQGAVCDAGVSNPIIMIEFFSIHKAWLRLSVTPAYAGKR